MKYNLKKLKNGGFGKAFDVGWWLFSGLMAWVSFWDGRPFCELLVIGTIVGVGILNELIIHQYKQENNEH